MSAPLEDTAARAAIDQDGSYERIHGLPEQCLEAWQSAREFKLPTGYEGIDKLVVAGIGGSAIAADLVQALVVDTSPIPMTVVRGYDLPKWLDARTLVVACSHSGNTEETLSAFDQAMASPAKVAVVTTGGKIAEVAQAKGVPALLYEYPNVPRDALGHGIMRLLAIARALGMVQVDDARIEAVVRAMQMQRDDLAWEVDESENGAKQTARSLQNLLPFTVGGGFMGPVARRWRTQMDENADVFALWDELPELNHNLVVGLRHPADLLRSIRAIFINHAAIHPRTRLRYDLTVELFERAGISTQSLLFPQEDPLTAQLCAVHFGDLVSYYLAILKGTRPVEIENINWLKDQLSRQ